MIETYVMKELHNLPTVLEHDLNQAWPTKILHELLLWPITTRKVCRIDIQVKLHKYYTFHTYWSNKVLIDSKYKTCSEFEFHQELKTQNRFGTMTNCSITDTELLLFDNPEQTILKGILLSYAKRKASLWKINKHFKNDTDRQIPK